MIANTSRFNPHHVVSPTSLTLQECLKVSDVVISAVPSKDYKVKTEWLKDGCICVNVAGDKNFEADVRQKVCSRRFLLVWAGRADTTLATGINLRPIRRANDDRHAPAKPVAAAQVQGDGGAKGGGKVVLGDGRRGFKGYCKVVHRIDCFHRMVLKRGERG